MALAPIPEFNALNSPNHCRNISSRFVLYVGFKCNIRCQFCYYLKSIENGTAQNSTYDDLAKKIKEARKFGKSKIDFTGGEPTIHPDLPRLIALCKNEGFETINVISNGIMLSRKDYFEDLVRAGLNEVLLSVHSHLPDVHDELTKSKGSFDRIIQAAGHARDLGVNLRFNTCINQINHHLTDDLLNFFKKFKPQSVNLIVFNSTEETPDYSGHDNVRLAKLSDVADSIRAALDHHENEFPDLNVRFLPFCFLKGKERYIRTYWQEIYEEQEWDPALHWAFRKGWWFSAGAMVAGFFYSLAKPGFLFTGRKNLWTRLCEYLQNIRIAIIYKKPKSCGGCTLRNICPGMQRDFLKQQGTSVKTHPYKSADYPVIINPVLFGWPTPEKFRALFR